MRKFRDVVQDSLGNVLSGVNATVRVANASPGTGALATIYSDDGVTVTGNPVVTDSTGTFQFYVADGRYDITISGGALAAPVTVADLEIADVLQAFSTDATLTAQNISANSAMTSPCFKSNGVCANTGLIRLAKTDTVKVRNNTNSADLTVLALDSAFRTTDYIVVGDGSSGVHLQGTVKINANIQGDGLFNHIQITPGTPSAVNGKDVTILGGSSTLASAAGGHVRLTGGGANTPGPAAGGNVILTPGAGTGGGSNGTIQFVGTVGQVGSNTTIGIPGIVAGVDLTAQTAAVGTTTLYSVTNAGQYRLQWNSKVTTAAGTSSTLGALTIVYTDPDGVAQTITAGAQTSAGAIATTTTTNTTAAVLLGVPILINAKAGTNITYAFAYASNPANAMNYNLHLKLEAL